MKQRKTSKFPSRNSEAYSVHVIWMGFSTTENINNKNYVTFMVSSIILLTIIIIIVSSQFFSLNFHFPKTVVLKTYSDYEVTE